MKTEDIVTLCPKCVEFLKKPRPFLHFYPGMEKNGVDPKDFNFETEVVVDRATRREKRVIVKW